MHVRAKKTRKLAGMVEVVRCEVQMGVDGCKWVRMGALGRRGHGEHTNKVRRGHLGSSWSEFGPYYGRENFPGHDVLWFS